MVATMTVSVPEIAAWIGPAPPAWMTGNSPDSIACSASELPGMLITSTLSPCFS
jgi:hypothetical protein